MLTLLRVPVSRAMGGSHAGSGLGPRHLQARSREEWHGELVPSQIVSSHCVGCAGDQATSRQLARAAELDSSQNGSEVIVLPFFDAG